MRFIFRRGLFRIVSDIKFNAEAHFVDINYRNLSNERLYALGKTKNINFLDGRGCL
ncbi:MAG: hypothetical protein CM15mP22_5400 [Gammaproteobacteria bacterium]|nr:MAG: hypothetical protein CM15mP22_5400 [Gammaproteobacteria bacterium]